MKEISQVERDGFMFLLAESLWLALFFSLLVSWGVSINLFHALNWFLSWLTWVVGVNGLFIYTPFVCWWGYKRGIWDD